MASEADQATQDLIAQLIQHDLDNHADSLIQEQVAGSAAVTQRLCTNDSTMPAKSIEATTIPHNGLDDPDISMDYKGHPDPGPLGYLDYRQDRGRYNNANRGKEGRGREFRINDALTPSQLDDFAEAWVNGDSARGFTPAQLLATREFLTLETAESIITCHLPHLGTATASAPTLGETPTVPQSATPVPRRNRSIMATGLFGESKPASPIPTRRRNDTSSSSRVALSTRRMHPKIQPAHRPNALIDHDINPLAIDVPDYSLFPSSSSSIFNSNNIDENDIDTPPSSRQSWQRSSQARSQIAADNRSSSPRQGRPRVTRFSPILSKQDPPQPSSSSHRRHLKKVNNAPVLDSGLSFPETPVALEGAGKARPSSDGKFERSSTYDPMSSWSASISLKEHKKWMEQRMTSKMDPDSAHPLVFSSPPEHPRIVDLPEDPIFGSSFRASVRHRFEDRFDDDVAKLSEGRFIKIPLPGQVEDDLVRRGKKVREEPEVVDIYVGEGESLWEILGSLCDA